MAALAHPELTETAKHDMRTDFDRNCEARSAQAAWANRSVRERLLVLRGARGILARMSGDLAEAISSRLARTHADTLASEVLPLLAACKFLEGKAVRLLKPRRLGRRGLPFWLAGVDSEVQRVPCGVVLVIGPANYPLFLPGVQTLQALAAGNAVVWKPGQEGHAVAEIVAAALERAGLPPYLLRIADESVEAAEAEIAARPDKIFFTGSGPAAKSVLRAAAETLTPCVIEASGCDAAIVLPSADPARVVSALAFGMRFNGSATCMAPRRLLLVGSGHEALLAALQRRLSEVDGVVIPEKTRFLLRELMREAQRDGATLMGDPDAIFLRPLLLLNGRPELRIAQSDIFAPVLTVIACPSEADALSAQRACPYALTAAVFGEPAAARALGDKLDVGTVLINDLIVPTADPRVPFGGRRASGFGVTRGAEGLLEMTVCKSVSTRRGSDIRHYGATGEAHEELFTGVIQMSHSSPWTERWSGLTRMIAAAKRLK